MNWYRFTKFAAIDEKRLIKLYRQGLSLREMERQFGIPRKTLSKKIDELKLKKLISSEIEIERQNNQQEKSVFSGEEIDKIVDLYRQGFSQKKIGKVFGRSLTWANGRLKRLREKKIITKEIEQERQKNLKEKGIKSTRKRQLTQEEIDKFVDLYRKGYRQKEIGMEFSGTQAWVSKKILELRIKKIITEEVEQERQKNQKEKGIFSGGKMQLNQEEIDKLVDLYRKGYRQKEIGKVFGYKRKWVDTDRELKLLRKKNIITEEIEQERRNNQKERGIHTNKKIQFTQEEIDKFVDLYRKGYLQEKIGKVFGYTQSWAGKQILKLRIKNIITKEIEKERQNNSQKPWASTPIGLEGHANASYHELIIGDIFFINGESFQREVYIGDELCCADLEKCFKPRVDFLFGDVVFEVFGGGPGQAVYLIKMRCKISEIPKRHKMGWLDFTSKKFDVVSNRTLITYANYLDTEYQSSNTQAPYQPAISTLQAKMPLLTEYGLKISNSYAKWIKSIVNQREEIRQRVRPDLKLRTAQAQPPTLQQIDSELRSQFKSVDYWGELEKIAVYFKTQENIMPYIQQMENELQQISREQEVPLERAAESIFNLIK